MATNHTENHRLLVIVADDGKFNNQKYQRVSKEIDAGINKIFYRYQIDLLREDGMQKLCDSIGDEDINSPDKIVRHHLVGLGNKEGYDYIALVYFLPAAPNLDFANSYFSNRCLNVSMAVKVVDVKSGRYMYNKIVKSGTVTETTLLWGKADVQLWYRGVGKCMRILEKDFANMRN